MPHIRPPMAILSIFLTVVIVIVSILIVLLVLVQRPKQEGLGAAFGGGAFDSALGAHTTDALKKMTAWLAAVFFVTAIGLAIVKGRHLVAEGDVLEKVGNNRPAATSLPSAEELLQNVTDIPLIKDPKADAPKADAPKADAPKADAPKADAPKADAPKADAPKADAPKADAPKADAPKADAPKADAPKAEAPKAEAPKSGSQ